MNPFPLPTRAEHRLPTGLKLLFCLVVKTIYFISGYRAVLGPWKANMLLRELAILIVRMFRTLRNYREVCFFGKKFLIRVRTAISVNQNGQAPIRGVTRFFLYLQELELFLQQPRKLQDSCLEMLLGRLPFAADENIPDLHLPDGTIFRSADLKEFRLAGGLPVRVPLTLNETFPTNFQHPTPVQIDTGFLDPLHYSHYPHCFLFR